MSETYEPSPKEVDAAVESARQQVKEYCAEHHIPWEESDVDEREAIADAVKSGWEVVDLPGGDLNIGITPETMPEDYNLKVIDFGKTWKVLRKKKAPEDSERG